MAGEIAIVRVMWFECCKMRALEGVSVVRCEFEGICCNVPVL